MHLSARLRPSLGAATGLVLGLLALGPGLRRGFLLSYDMVFVPREPFTSAMFGLSGGPPRAVPSDFAVAVASRLLPADIVQKLVLLLPWAADRTPAWNHGEVMLDAWPRLVSRQVIWNDGTVVGNIRVGSTGTGNLALAPTTRGPAP